MPLISSQNTYVLLKFKEKIVTALYEYLKFQFKNIDLQLIFLNMYLSVKWKCCLGVTKFLQLNNLNVMLICKKIHLNDNIL